VTVIAPANLSAGEKPALWDSVQGHILDNIVEINRVLAQAGMPLLETPLLTSAPSPPSSDDD
jgi:hypothetical protein